jgi:hypothetical protein
MTETGGTKEQFAATELGKYLGAGLVAPTEAAGKKFKDPGPNIPFKDGLRPAGPTKIDQASDLATKSITADSLVIGDKNLVDIFKKAAGQPSLPTVTTNGAGGRTVTKPVSGTRPPTFKTITEANAASADKSKNTFTDSNGTKWNLVVNRTGANWYAPGGWSMPAVKAGKGLMDIDPRVPTVVGDMGPELLYNNMIIPDINNIPFATPTYDVNSGRKSFANLATQSEPQQPIVLNQTIVQAPGENTDALVRKVSQATIEILDKGSKRSISEIGSRRS